MNMQSVNPENLQTSIAKIYQTFGLTEDKAALLADTLVMADLWGHSSHGVMRTSWYAARLKSRVMDPFAELEIKTA
ncbi:MAG: Ldh family oxidoreductase, partial [Candidatus Puniceispirillaceae bacterium]